MLDIVLAVIVTWPLATAFWALVALGLVLFICWMWAKAFRAELEFADQAAELKYWARAQAVDELREKARRSRSAQHLTRDGL